jgi:hypothetical protein
MIDPDCTKADRRRVPAAASSGAKHGGSSVGQYHPPGTAGTSDAEAASKRAYDLALASGASPPTAADVACAKYRVFYPAISEFAVCRVVTRLLARWAAPQLPEVKMTDDSEPWQMEIRRLIEQRRAIARALQTTADASRERLERKSAGTAHEPAGPDRAGSR